DAAGRTREVRTPVQSCIGAHVLPQRENGVLIRQPSEIAGRRWETRCDESSRFVCIDKIETTVGANVHPVVGSAVQLEAKRQRNKRIAFVAIAAGVCITRHDGIVPLGYDVLACLTRVAARESLVKPANWICDRHADPSPRQAFAELASRLFNRAHKHGSVLWKEVRDWSP